MEALLSLAFDNLSSYDGVKIRKGLRQVEGVLAQICLIKQTTTPAERRRSMVSAPAASNGMKDLGALVEDPAFREFFKLQEGFEWNYGQNDLLILATLDLIQGVLLLHPPSRSLFSREIYMNLLLDLLDPTNCPAIQSLTLLVLVCVLLEQPSNTRTFETLDGLLTIASLFKSRSTSREVKLKLLEFIYFYLMPETPSIPTSAPNTSALSRSPSKLASAFVQSERKGFSASNQNTKETEEKQALLGRYLGDVQDLVEDLRESAPFGGRIC
ncbi:MAG: hypothetical protein M1829_006222 [Trizodia sp. TS-e1964]|nr:MAG: hypothetical protein M1829_006222 [Trizodia sp. TS-e1964]